MLNKYSDYEIVNLDKLTYAGNLDNLRDIQKSPRYKFIKGDICDKEVAEKAMRDRDVVINFTAESHVDRNIAYPEPFIKTDVFEIFILLEISKKYN